jgi:hypothetical protein
MSARINILKVNEFHASNLVATSLKPLGNQGGKSVSINYKFPEGQSILTIQTPWMTSYGINKWVDEKKPDMPPKLSVNLSFRGVEADAKLKEVQTFLEELDEWAIDTIHKNSGAWLKIKSAPRDTIAFNYSPSFKIPTDKDSGEPNGKPAFIKLKLTQGENGYSATFFDKERKVIETDDVESSFITGSKVKALVQCTGFWIVSGKFGLTWKLKQLIIDPPSRIGKEYAFNDDDEEDTPSHVAASSVPVPVPAPAPLVAKQEAPTSIIEDSDEDKEPEPEPAETVATVRKVVRKVVTKK